MQVGWLRCRSGNNFRPKSCKRAAGCRCNEMEHLLSLDFHNLRSVNVKDVWSDVTTKNHNVNGNILLMSWYHLSSQHFCCSRLKSHSENLKIWINPLEVWKYLPGYVTGQTRCPLTSTFRDDCNSATHDHIWICFGVVISCRFWRPLSIMTSYRFASRWRFLTNYMLISIYTLSWVQWDQARPLATPRSCPRPRCTM